MKILIKTPNWLGDCVMSLPAILAVREIFSSSEIYIWTKQSLIDFWELVPGVNGIITETKRKEFDLGILLTNSFGSALRMFFKGVSERRGYSIRGRGFLLTQPVKLKPNSDKLHDTDYFLGIIEGLGKIDIEKEPKIEVSSEIIETAKNILFRAGWDKNSKIIGIHATASYGLAKCWPAERFGELIDKLIDLYKANVVIVGSKDEVEKVGNIKSLVKNNSKIIDLSGKTNMKKLAGVMKLCDVFIANDSGPMHLAGAVGVPVVAIFGSTALENTAPGGDCIIIKKEVPCSPCFKRECGRGMECMQLIEVADVLNAVGKIIKK